MPRGIVVHFPRFFVGSWQFSLTLTSQVAAFFVNAVTSGYFFVRWWRLPSSLKQRIWNLYGWFAGLMCSGSCFGTLYGASLTEFQTFFFLSGFDPDSFAVNSQQAVAISNVIRENV